MVIDRGDIEIASSLSCCSTTSKPAFCGGSSSMEVLMAAGGGLLGTDGYEVLFRAEVAVTTLLANVPCLAWAKRNDCLLEP